MTSTGFVSNWLAPIVSNLLGRTNVCGNGLVSRSGAAKSTNFLVVFLCGGFAVPVLAEDPTQDPALARELAQDFIEPAAPSSKLALSANTTFTTDYVDQGISQTDENPAVQAGFELTYEILYLGVWGSNVDFGLGINRAGNLEAVADLEIDLYGGIRPEWKGISFDLGILYYTYPGSLGNSPLDYRNVEFGTAAFYTFFEKLTLGVTNTWLPQNTGYVDVLEGSASYALKKIQNLHPSVSALVGRQWDERSEGSFDYTYWNAGLTLEFNEQPSFSLDVRYWDTNIASCAAATVFQCDERVVTSVVAIF